MVGKEFVKLTKSCEICKMFWHFFLKIPDRIYVNNMTPAYINALKKIYLVKNERKKISSMHFDYYSICNLKKIHIPYYYYQFMNWSNCEKILELFFCLPSCNYAFRLMKNNFLSSLNCLKNTFNFDEYNFVMILT